MTTLSPDDLKPKVYCTSCALYQNCNTNRMKAVGDKSSEVLFVLDNPNRQEDSAGRALVSDCEIQFRALVNKVLGGKYRVSFTKAVKCFPADSTVGVRVIRECRDKHLLKELENPSIKVVVAVGNKALCALTDVNGGISSVSGTIVESPYFSKVFAIISPTVMLYDENAKGRIERDLVRLRDLVLLGKKETKFSPTIQIAKTKKGVGKALYKLSKAEMLAVDFETSHKSANPFSPAEITCISLSDGNFTLVLPCPAHPECPTGLGTIEKEDISNKPINFDAEPKPRLTGAYKALFEFLSGWKKSLVAHNAVMEKIWSRRYGYHVRFTHDTMLLAYQLNPDNKGEFGLDSIVSNYFPEAGLYWKDIPSLSKVDTREIELGKLAKYNGLDSAVLPNILTKLSTALTKRFSKVFDWKETHNYFLKYSVTNSVRMQYNGWHVDEGILHNVQKELVSQINKTNKEFQDYPETKKAIRLINKKARLKYNNSVYQKYDDADKIAKAMDRFKPITELNTKSPQHSQILIYECLRNSSGAKFPKTLFGKSGPTTEAKALDSLLKTHFGVTEFGELKCAPYLKRDLLNRLRHYLSTYCVNIIDEHFVGGYVHPSYLQIGTATGRYSSKDPNGQNYPERPKELAKLLKSMYTSRFKGGGIIGADFGQIEPRVACAYGKDKDLLEIFKSDRDLYSEIAYQIFVKVGTAIISKKGAKKDLDKNGKKSRYRWISKQITLAILYQKTAYSLANDLGIEVEDAENIISSFLKGFKGIRRYIRNILQFAKKHRFVISNPPILARMTPNISAKDECKWDTDRESFKRLARLQSEDERIAVNTPIQGVGSGAIPIIAGVLLAEYLKKNKILAVLVGNVHDALYLDYHPKHLDKAKAAIKYIMENVAKLSSMLKWLRKVPLKADVKAGKTWADLIED